MNAVAHQFELKKVDYHTEQNYFPTEYILTFEVHFNLNSSNDVFAISFNSGSYANWFFLCCLCWFLITS